MADGRNPDKRFIPVARRRALKVPSAYLRDAVNTLYDLTPLKSDLDMGLHRNRAWHADTCIFSEAHDDPIAVRRRKSQVENAHHLLNVHRYIKGMFRGRVGDMSIDRDPNAIYIVDLSIRVEGVQSQSLMQSVFIPKAVLGYDPDHHERLIKYSGQIALGRLLASLHAELFDSLTRENSYSAETYEQFVSCLKLAFGTAGGEGDVRRQARAALKKQICSHIERHLNAGHDISVQSLLCNFGVSRASLFRMFQHDGGVRQYVSDRRLFRAVLEISDGPMLRGQITQIAEKWGFSSNPAFNRAVRRQFGVPPSGLVNLPDSETTSLLRSRPTVIGRSPGLYAAPNAYSDFSSTKIRQLERAKIAAAA